VDKPQLFIRVVGFYLPIMEFAIPPKREIRTLPNAIKKSTDSPKIKNSGFKVKQGNPPMASQNSKVIDKDI